MSSLGHTLTTTAIRKLSHVGQGMHLYGSEGGESGRKGVRKKKWRLWEG